MAFLRPLRKLGGAARRRWCAWRDGSPPVPVYFKLELSRTCNLRCAHCGYWKQASDPDALPLERWLELVDEIGRWAGPCHLTTTCGEPLESPAFFPVAERARGAGLAVTLVSNGTLIGPEEARRLRETGVRTLILSLDGAAAATHDRSRGVPGTHALVLRGLDCVGKEGLSGRTQLQAVIAEHNLAELSELVRLAERLGLEGIRFQALQPRGEGWRGLWPADPGAVSRAIDGLLGMKAGGSPVLNPADQLKAFGAYYRDPQAAVPGGTCRSARTLYVGSGGAVYACRSMEPLGDARRTPLREVWRSAAPRLAEIGSCRRACLLMNCHYPAPGRAW